jgi:hypothetical protein
MPFSGKNAMKLSKLSKEKRQQFVLVVVLTVGILAGLGFGLVKSQYQSLERVASSKADTGRKLRQIQDTVKRSPQLDADLRQAKATLASVSADLAAGDLYDSVYTMVRKFKANSYQVQIPQFGPSQAVVDVNCLSGFPFKQVSMPVNGTARYQEFGRFLADFENQFPHVRVVNLSLEPVANSASGPQETVSFRMDIVTLVSLNTP